MSTSITHLVDASRLEQPGEDKENRTGAGDIPASYSADTIAFQGTVRKPFYWRGEPWIAVGLSGIEGVQQAHAVRLVAVELFDDGTTTYRERCGVKRAARARRSPMGFYHGIKVTRGGMTYILTGPEERFVAGTASSVEEDDPYLQ